MRFALLGSGSRGNATVITTDNTTILIDCGFSGREAQRRLSLLGLTPYDIDAILVTHEHADHIAGVGVLSRRFDLPVWMTRGCAGSERAGRINDLRLLSPSTKLVIGELTIQVVATEHDSAEPCHYIVDDGESCLGLLSDTGEITTSMIAAYARCSTLMLESNHDLDMLERGPYPPSLKARVAGRYGHLNNQQAAEYLAQRGGCDTDLLRKLVIAHISEKNNSLEKVRGAIEPALRSDVLCHYASQNEVLGWLEVR